jgi:coenzyme F420-reducing hydrogenase gamma subunit
MTNLPKKVLAKICSNRRKKTAEDMHHMDILAQRTRDAEIAETYFVYLGFPPDIELVREAIHKTMQGNEENPRSIVNEMLYEILEIYKRRTRECNPRRGTTDDRIMAFMEMF